MALKYIRCTRCGGNLERNDNTFKCSHCNATFVEDYVEQNEKLISEFLTELKQEKVAALRQRLWEQVNAKYLSSEEISSIAKKIREYLPEDFLACFYEAACSKNKDDVIDFISNIDYEKEYMNLDLVIEFMLRNLNQEKLLSVNNLIEKAYKERNLVLFSKYSTELSNEAEKIEKGVYDTILPRDVFIAYSSKDMKVVENVTSFLEAQGLKCFVAMRNLRHGVGAVENYDKALEEAIDNCKIFLFISSNNSRNLECDAVRKEIPYVMKDDKSTAPEYKHNYKEMPQKYKKPRIQYLLDVDNNSIGGEKVKEFFDGYGWCQTLEELKQRVSDIIFNSDIDDETIDNKSQKDNKLYTNTNAREKEKSLESKETNREETINIFQGKSILEKYRKNDNTQKETKKYNIVSENGFDYIYFGSYPQGPNGEIEPIKWRILSQKNNELFLLSEYILDTKRFDAKSNNYKNSEIRKWLNNEFYNKAFNKEEKAMILTTEVDNSSRSTNPNSKPNKWNDGKNKYACNKTKDKIFLLSQQEVTNSAYGFEEDTKANDSVRQKQGTEYAKKHGLWVGKDGFSVWWLRSPYFDYSNYAQYVNRDGYAFFYNYVNFTTKNGVLPALKIKLS